jgi:Rps23 Pro-64 3,4-dihydroxylase Tpa1-like proline 4-hydroxylase
LTFGNEPDYLSKTIVGRFAHAGADSAHKLDGNSFAFRDEQGASVGRRRVHEAECERGRSPVLTQSTLTTLPESDPSRDDRQLFPYERYESRADDLARTYRSGPPFPHLFFENFLDPTVIHELAEEFPMEANDHWVRYRHVNENKASIDRWEDLPPKIAAVLRELNSPRFLALVSKITGIPGLLADPDIDGGGMHQAWRGGFLNLHTDFTMHRHKPTWRRRCNLILYLNENWDDAWGGAIEVWDGGANRCVDSMPCHINRALLFDTPNALHGFPEPLQCPEDRSRKSLQLYYYTVDEAPEVPVATTYYARPKDSLVKRLLVRADNRALSMYDTLKRRLGISDAFVSKVMAMLGGRKHH